MNEIIKGTKE